MKKFTAIALLSITLVACKKDTKTVTKVDPETGKTITVEVPVTSTDSLKVETPQAEIFAIKDSLGVYKQTFKLEKGETYPLVTYQKDVQTMTAPDGKSQSGTSEMTDEMSFTVNDFKDGVYDITINLTGKRNSQSANGKTAAVDTKQAEPKDEQLKMMWKVNKALVGNKLNLKMTETGKVISITGFDTIYNKIAASVGTVIKDQKDKAGFINSFKQSFNEKMLKDQFSKNLVLIPAKGAKIGDKWSESENATPDGKIKLTTTYTLKSVGDGIAQISVAGGIPKKTDKQTKEGVTRSMSSELSQNGTIILDQKTGWVKNQNISVKTTQTETLSDGKQSQTMKSVSNSTVVVNPKK
ncbi:DUF6263 family protein [Kaistella antarctica]|uniref:Uncharacterized protein n=1 Tax=Kaistella antarctica TaxID=266748 RepID=A0A3S5EUQ9_9FLAO|nr:DUF6263 family protein [Kaistella antarctica]KEY19164.1 hypothetical protein HY04_12130 [Kaistella antarctica]SEW03525.1 hypothetical protein SAMN05421765_1869 [Kaistella antarctica]VEH98783.1 Uncharacterised protein [Kaistella antarctica]